MRNTMIAVLVAPLFVATGPTLAQESDAKSLFEEVAGGDVVLFP